MFHIYLARIRYSGWGYGAIYTTNMLVLERYAQGTNWTIPDPQFDLLAHLVLDGQAQSTRGANFDFLSCGRLFTCPYARHRVAVGLCVASAEVVDPSALLLLGDAQLLRAWTADFDKTDSFGVNQGHYHYFAAFTPFELAFPDFQPPFTTPIGVFFAPLLGSIGSTNRRYVFAQTHGSGSPLILTY